jgi:hypothetical protein
VTHKSARIAERVAAFRGADLDARYVGYFDCFNREEFYEAHDVLEDLWLLDRRGPDGDFYKALIQLAGAFVHLQKGRLQPCVALLRLARGYLGRYPTTHHRLDVAWVMAATRLWERRVTAALAGSGKADAWDYPRLKLIGAAGSIQPEPARRSAEAQGN